MDIGEQKRVIVVEPLEVPDEIDAGEPDLVPETVEVPARPGGQTGMRATGASAGSWSATVSDHRLHGPT